MEGFGFTRGRWVEREPCGRQRSSEIQMSRDERRHSARPPTIRGRRGAGHQGVRHKTPDTVTPALHPLLPRPSPSRAPVTRIAARYALAPRSHDPPPGGAGPRASASGTIGRGKSCHHPLRHPSRTPRRCARRVAPSLGPSRAARLALSRPIPHALSHLAQTPRTLAARRAAAPAGRPRTSPVGLSCRGTRRGWGREPTCSRGGRENSCNPPPRARSSRRAGAAAGAARSQDRTAQGYP